MCLLFSYCWYSCICEIVWHPVSWQTHSMILKTVVIVNGSLIPYVLNHIISISLRLSSCSLLFAIYFQRASAKTRRVAVSKMKGCSPCLLNTRHSIRIMWATGRYFEATFGWLYFMFYRMLMELTEKGRYYGRERSNVWSSTEIDTQRH